MSGTILNNNFTTNLVQDLVRARWDGTPVTKLEFMRLGYENIKSDKYQETIAADDMMGYAEIKPEGVAGTFTSAEERLLRTTTNITLYAAFQISEEAMEDGKGLNLVNRYAPQTVDMINRSKEIIGAGIFNNGYTQTCWDGTAIFGTSHPLTMGGTQANILATPAVLSKTAVQDLITVIDTCLNLSGIKAAINPRRILIHPSNKWVAEEITKSYFDPETGNNAVNPLVTMSIIPEGFATNRYFTNEDNWFLLTDAKEGLVYYERTNIRTKSEDKFDELVQKHAAYQRCSFDIANYLNVFGSGNIT
jgi:hypothetical protein